MMLDKSSYHECTDLTGYRKEMGELVHMFRKDKLSLNKVRYQTAINMMRNYNTKTVPEVLNFHQITVVYMFFCVFTGTCC